MNLQPVDFKAVAAKGCYVYCYLRESGTPYYVGIASNAARPFEKHGCGVPRKHPERVRVMRSGLSWEEACQWEIRYIARYGRKDIGTGTLRNRTDGGDGTKGYQHTEEAKRRIQESNRKDSYPHLVGRPVSEATRRLISESQKGKTITPEAIELIKAARARQVITDQHKQAISVALKGRKCDESHKAAMRNGNQRPDRLQVRACNTKAAWEQPGERAKRSAAISASKAARKAQQFGFTVEEWMSLTKNQRETAADVRPKAQALGYTLKEWWALSRSTKITLLAQLRAA